MGKCRCGKRSSVLFCYQHGENVCYECLDTERHETCDIRSTQAWLSDVDVCKQCELCREDLSLKKTVRLNCLHVFHWDCLDQLQKSLPGTTAPAGRKCPNCTSPIIPPANSWFASRFLKEQLALVDWGRLAPPQIHDHRSAPSHNFTSDTTSYGNSTVETNNSAQINNSAHQNYTYDSPAESVPERAHVISNHQTQQAAYTAPRHDQVITVPDFYSGNEVTSVSQRMTSADNFTGSHHREQDSVPLLHDTDSDERKYQRRPASEWLRGIWRSRYGNSSPGRFCRSKLMILLIVIFFIFAIIITASRRTGEDPLLDPMANPNIRIADE